MPWMLYITFERKNVANSNNKDLIASWYTLSVNINLSFLQTDTHYKIHHIKINHNYMWTEQRIAWVKKEKNAVKLHKVSFQKSYKLPPSRPGSLPQTKKGGGGGVHPSIEFEWMVIHSPPWRLARWAVSASFEKITFCHFGDSTFTLGIIAPAMISPTKKS